MSLRVKVKILDPIPPGVAFSYGPFVTQGGQQFRFAKFGVGVWEYAEDTFGPIHWINWRTQIFEPEYINAIRFHYWFQRDILAEVHAYPVVDEAVPSQLVQGQLINLMTGAGLPFTLPF